MKKNIQDKNLSFLKNKRYVTSGIYDNKNIYENTKEAYILAIQKGYNLKIDIHITIDNIIICYSDDNLMRLLHVDSNIKDVTFDDITYISKFNINKFEDIINILPNTNLLIEIHNDINNTNYYKMVVDILKNSHNQYAIESNNIKVLKYFNKYYPDIIIGYKIDRSNYKRIHLFKNYDFIDIDINLYPDKYIRKLREDEFILGHNIRSNIDYFNKKEVYDNLVCDLKVEDY